MIKLEPLPYSDNHETALSALEPHISAETLKYHYELHHKGYVTKLNQLIDDNSGYENLDLDEIIIKSSNNVKDAVIFNNAAQIWNHAFYWESMKKNGGGMPNAELLKRIEESFGSFDAFATMFKEQGMAQFGSGWVWLVFDPSDNGKLKILKTPNAGVPFIDGYIPLCTMDVWEHAYYIDYRNKRIEYADIFIKHLINWDFVQENLNIVKDSL